MGWRLNSRVESGMAQGPAQRPGCRAPAKKIFQPERYFNQKNIIIGGWGYIFEPKIEI